jgi:hypothetical protein
MTVPQVAAPPTTNSRRTAWLIFGAVCLVALGGLAWRFVPTIGPYQTAAGYCDDLTHQRYTAIYQRLGGNAQASVSQAIFTGAEQLADQQAGKVTQCSASPLNVSAQANDTQAQVTEQRQSGITIVATLHMVGSSIATLPDPAIMPFAVAQRFCDALTTQDYASAYHLLSGTITGQLAQDRYVKLQQFADQTQGNVTTCTITQLDLAKDDTGATATAQVQRQHGAAGGTTTPIQLASSALGWQITNLPSA